MAQDSDVPKAADKGKGKAVDDGKEEKPTLNGKQEEEKKESAFRQFSNLKGGEANLC